MTTYAFEKQTKNPPRILYTQRILPSSMDPLMKDKKGAAVKAFFSSMNPLVLQEM